MVIFRTATHTKYLFVMIIFLSYDAMLYSSLTVTSTRLPYNNIEELLQDDKVNLYTYGDNHFIYKTIKTSKTGLTWKIWQRMKKSPNEGGITDYKETKNLLSHDNNATNVFKRSGYFNKILQTTPTT
uniref:Uncharacterized protein n=1 Tax=Strigamia maritima TaxID=126957 RepID=T1JFE4_STRMM